jgi:hypothetical protein
MLWASRNEVIAGAFSRMATAIDQAGLSVYPPEVGRLVTGYLQSWRGESPPLGRTWLEQTIQNLAEDEKPSARLALLTALAPHQVDEKVINDFRAIYPDDVQLINALAWASFSAARRIGSRLAVSNFPD